MKKMNIALKMSPMISILLLFTAGQIGAQFVEDFNGPSIILDGSGNNGWGIEKGSGIVTVDLEQGDGYGTIHVDATMDKLNVWWALIKRRVSAQMDLSLLSDPKYELRVEACVRSNHAPRRFNIRLQTQRTTNFHLNLMEFDIADTVNWHTVSMTTENFDGKPGDNVYVTLALIDWGLETYRLDVDYIKVDIVDVDTVGPDLGVPVPYQPPVPGIETFDAHVPVAHDAMIDSEFTTWIFNNWSAQGETSKTTLLTVGGSQYVIMKWDLDAYAGKQISGSGLLELTTYEAEHTPDYQSDFGMVRAVEILGGNANWDQKRVTYDNFCNGQPLNKVLNEQMIIDFYASENRDSTNLLTIPNPVLQRMIDGKTLGIALRPLGAVHASFYAIENGDPFNPKLHFNMDTTSAAFKTTSYMNIPKTYRLEQNYPNPFNPGTMVKYALVKSAQVELAIYNVHGQKIRILVNGHQEPGEYALIWDGKNDEGKSVGSGVYFYRLRTDQIEMQRKMMMLR